MLPLSGDDADRRKARQREFLDYRLGIKGKRFSMWILVGGAIGLFVVGWMLFWAIGTFLSVGSAAVQTETPLMAAQRKQMQKRNPPPPPSPSLSAKGPVPSTPASTKEHKGSILSKMEERKLEMAEKEEKETKKGHMHILRMEGLKWNDLQRDEYMKKEEEDFFARELMETEASVAAAAAAAAAAEAEAKALEEKGDELLMETSALIEVSRVADATRLLNEAKDVYQRAGLLSENVDKYKMHELYKNLGATAKELALSGVADSLYQAKARILEMQRVQREEAAQQERDKAEALRAAQKQEEQFVKDLQDRERKATKMLQAKAKKAAEEAMRNGRKTSDAKRKAEEDPDEVEAERQFQQFKEEQARKARSAPSGDTADVQDTDSNEREDAADETGTAPDREDANPTDSGSDEARSDLGQKDAAPVELGKDTVPEKGTVPDASDTAPIDMAPKSEPEPKDLDSALNMFGLEMYKEQLQHMGVESLEDLQYLDDENLQSIRAKPIHRKKFNMLVQKYVRTKTS